MTRKSILGFSIAATLLVATAAALIAQAALTTSKGGGHHYSYNQINRPSYLKGKILEDCLENPECALKAW